MKYAEHAEARINFLCSDRKQPRTAPSKDGIHVLARLCVGHNHGLETRIGKVQRCLSPP